MPTKKTANSNSKSKSKSKSVKRRAEQNRLGERGEKKFDAAAVDYGLIAQPVTNDYGYDFIFSIDEDPASNEPSSISGSVVAVSVRATKRPDGRITLDRADAGNLLRANMVTMVALVHLPAAGDCQGPIGRSVSRHGALGLSGSETMSIQPALVFSAVRRSRNALNQLKETLAYGATRRDSPWRSLIGMTARFRPRHVIAVSTTPLIAESTIPLIAESTIPPCSSRRAMREPLPNNAV